jgi:Flp pilus assembly protein TadG
MAIVRPWKRLRRDRRGNVAVEFALGVPILVIGMVGIMELGMMTFTDAILESAVLEASRYGTTGNMPPGKSRAQKIVGIVADRTMGLVDMRKAKIHTLIYPTFGDIGKPEPFTDANGNGTYDPGEHFADVNRNGKWDADMGAAGLGGPGDVVVYRVQYKVGAMTGLLKPILGDMTHTASVAVRNEPY